MTTEERHIDIADRIEEIKLPRDHHVKEFLRRNDHIWVSEDQKMLIEQMNQGDTSATANRERNESDITKIQSVADVMRQSEKSFNDDSYKPRALSIGPIHRAAPEFQFHRSKQRKINLAAKFIKESGNKWDGFLKLFKDKIDEDNLIKGFFEEEILLEYDYDSLVWLLFLDGCAVLKFIHSYVLNTGELTELQISNADAALIHEDLFLLENQIPFKLLDLLMEQMKDKKDEYLDAIYIFVLKSNLMAPIDCWSHDLNVQGILSAVEALKRSSKLPIHLLHALRSVLLDDHDTVDDVGNVDGPNKDYLSSLDIKYPELPEHMRNMLKGMHQDNKMSFRNVQELKSAGIQIKSSDSENMRSISFSRRWFGNGGCLIIPPINVDNSTARKLLNLVAYEVRLRDSGKKACYLVTSYVHFMDLLIDNEADVKELRKAGILRHRLSSDNEVASLFNNLGSNCLLLKSEEDVFIQIKTEIDKHFEKRLPKLIAEFRRKYFSSPWALISLLFVLVTAYLTLLQDFSSTINPRAHH
ncbi:UPF0481 protein At3g47200-like [Humulus lupulus]|uniref:UPF0481 protein At3g47200-like n=1 Tax=Humulus lupulus TaxID=3486 RepID=UPI002B404871|nr:UPF0481 protein At3g47200-like [Humulus lupulus]